MLLFIVLIKFFNAIIKGILANLNYFYFSLISSIGFIEVLISTSKSSNMLFLLKGTPASITSTFWNSARSLSFRKDHLYVYKYNKNLFSSKHVENLFNSGLFNRVL